MLSLEIKGLYVKKGSSEISHGISMSVTKSHAHVIVK